MCMCAARVEVRYLAILPVFFSSPKCAPRGSDGCRDTQCSYMVASLYTRLRAAAPPVSEPRVEGPHGLPGGVKLGRLVLYHVGRERATAL
jgi:hypothetical protein